MARSPVMPMNGSVNQLRKHYWAVLANVYLPKGLQPSLQQRTVAAWLWSRRRGTIAGAAAAALRCARWIPDDVPIELVHPNARAPQPVLTRRDVLLDGEVQVISGLGVTTPERTAFDIGWCGAARSGVARLDSLARATGFKIDDVLAVRACHPGSPGLRRLETALERMGWTIVRVVAENPSSCHCAAGPRGLGGSSGALPNLTVRLLLSQVAAHSISGRAGRRPAPAPA